MKFQFDKQSTSFQLFLAIFSSALNKTALAPLELIKLRLQNNPALVQSKAIKKPYQGIADCLKTVLREQGSKGLFKGNGINVMISFPTIILGFQLKNSFRSLLAPQSEKMDPKKAIFLSIVSGGMTGIISLFALYPLEVARIRITNDVKSLPERRFKGGFGDVFKQILATDGVRGLYRGVLISSCGIFLYRGLYFGFYDSFKSIIPKQLEKNGFIKFTLGWSVTILSGFLCYPFDTVGKRLIMTAGEKQKFNGTFDAIRTIFKQEGYKSFFRGAGTSILKGIAGALIFMRAA